jgi:L-threonylcarbamoyladenylate synthase
VSDRDIKQAVTAFEQGGLLAYPTEAVFGVGCDPDNEQALQKLLALKKRPAEKGLILLAGSYQQLIPYIDDTSLTNAQRELILSRWPDGITQVMPKKPNLSPLLSGRFDTIAVRVTSQQNVVDLCQQTGKPIVSTSANLTGEIPALTWQELDPKLVAKLDFIVKGKTLGFDKPSTIIDAFTGETFRT